MYLSANSIISASSSSASIEQLFPSCKSQFPPCLFIWYFFYWMADIVDFMLFTWLCVLKNLGLCCLFFFFFPARQLLVDSCEPFQACF